MISNLIERSFSCFIIDQSLLLTNESDPFIVDVSSESGPSNLKTVLTWTDVPASPLGGDLAISNTIGLECHWEGGSYFGNNFVNGWSQPGGHQDQVVDTNLGSIVNNVQCIFFEKFHGNAEISIYPDDLIGDCLNPRDDASNEDSATQDFALVVLGDVQASNMTKL